jgi:hypothetical protein
MCIWFYWFILNIYIYIYIIHTCLQFAHKIGEAVCCFVFLFSIRKSYSLQNWEITKGWSILIPFANLGTFQILRLVCQHKADNRCSGTPKRLEQNCTSLEAGVRLMAYHMLFSDLLIFTLASARYTCFAISLLWRENQKCSLICVWVKCNTV